MQLLKVLYPDINPFSKEIILPKTEPISYITLDTINSDVLLYYLITSFPASDCHQPAYQLILNTLSAVCGY